MKNKNLDFRNKILPDERCQIKACPLTRDWENINHAIKPGCIKWKIKEQNNKPLLSTRMAADDWIPEVEDLSEDDTPPLVCDSDFSDSDSEDSSSDSEVELSSSNAGLKSTCSLPSRKSPMRAVNSNLKTNRQQCSTCPAVPVPNSATSRIGPFSYPVPGCPV